MYIYKYMHDACLYGWLRRGGNFLNVNRHVCVHMYICTPSLVYILSLQHIATRCNSLQHTAGTLSQKSTLWQLYHLTLWNRNILRIDLY